MSLPTLQLGSTGPAVEAAKRGVYTALRQPIPKNLTRVFGVFFRSSVKTFQGKKGIDQTGTIGPRTWTALLPYLDHKARDLLGISVAAVVYPHLGTNHSRPSFIHQTSGIAGNYALDFMAPGGTVVVAPEDGEITRLSGHPPSQGTINGDIFGWSIYIRVDDGFYYGTHFGTTSVYIGQTVRAGQKIGSVGHWPHDPGRSHTHLGFTARTGRSGDSIARIREVAAAPMIPAT